MSCVQGCELRQHKQCQPELCDTRAQGHRAAGYSDLATVQCCLLQPQGVTGTQSCQIPSAAMNPWTSEKTQENLIWETKPPEEKQPRFAYILTDVPQGNTAGFLQVERCVYTNPEQAADPCNHSLPASEPRHHSQAPLLASGGVFSNATMWERNVMGVPPTVSATPHW